MKLYIRKMTESYATEILKWSYAPPYDFYNNELSKEGIDEILNNQYLAVIDQAENLIGFYCIGHSAQVPKGNEFGVYEKKMVDIGLGVRPDLTGKGFGSEIFKFILEGIHMTTNLSTFRLTVAKFNKRAIRLYENFGFIVENEFYTERTEFITMVRVEKIRLAKENDLNLLVDLYDEVTLDLHRKGINQWSYPWDENKIKNEIASNTIYVLEINNGIIGSFSISLIEEIKNIKIKESSFYIAKIALLPKYQSQNLGRKIIEFAIRKAKSEGVSLYLDCWAGNDKLKQFYQNCGLKQLGDFPENDYSISIFMNEK